MSKILDNNADFQTLLENAPELPKSYVSTNSKKNNYGSVLITIVLSLAGIYVFNRIIQSGADRIIENIRNDGDDIDKPMMKF